MAKLDIPKIKTVHEDPNGGALIKQAGGVFDAGGTRILDGMESVEEATKAILEFARTQDAIMNALLAITDLVDYDGKDFTPKVQEYLVNLAKADPQDRPALKQRVVDGINNFIGVINAAEPIHSKKTDELMDTLQKLSRSLQTP